MILDLRSSRPAALVRQIKPVLIVCLQHKGGLQMPAGNLHRQRAGRSKLHSGGIHQTVGLGLNLYACSRQGRYIAAVLRQHHRFLAGIGRRNQLDLQGADHHPLCHRHSIPAALYSAAVNAVEKRIVHRSESILQRVEHAFLQLGVLQTAIPANLQVRLSEPGRRGYHAHKQILTLDHSDIPRQNGIGQGRGLIKIALR
ncbi:MAG: hypothetical protein BWY83_01253 [bacterium ADurb.Bin478]|nr:MAG: hypothetical protein BWY83_01253 [bacterium ADurb.Bin478]